MASGNFLGRHRKQLEKRGLDEMMSQDDSASQSSIDTIINVRQGGRPGRDEVNLDDRTLAYWEKSRLWSLDMIERFRHIPRAPDVPHDGIDIDPSQWMMMGLWKDVNQLCQYIGPLLAEVHYTHWFIVVV
jgi:hypothetical protein